MRQAARRAQAGLLLVFDEGGITGHSDHQQATRAALLFARRAGLPVPAWVVDQHVAASLNAEFGTSLAGRLEADDLVRSEWQAESGPPRRVYRPTASGAGLPEGWALSLRDMRSGIDQFLTLYDARR